MIVGMPRTPFSHSLVAEAEFIRRMATSADAIAKAVADGKLFFVIRDGRKLYPSFFIGQSNDDRRHLGEMTRLLAGVDDLAKWLFFTTPKGSLGAQTPLAALKERRFAAVRRTAEGFAQR